MMKLKDWNASLEYGHTICNELKKDGYDVIMRPYKMYDGRKGIRLQVLDAEKKVYREYMSGIVDTFEEMKNQLQKNADKIRREL